MPLEGYMYLLGEGKYKSLSGTTKSCGKVEGEAQDAQYHALGAFQIQTLQWGVSHSEQEAKDTPIDSSDRAGRAAAARKSIYANQFSKRFSRAGSSYEKVLTVKAVTITKEPDYSTPTLFHASCKGAIFPSAHVFFLKPTGMKRYKFLRFQFSSVMVDGWDINQDGDKITETLNLTFGWCQVRYTPQTAAGTKLTKANIKQFCTYNWEEEAPPQEMSSPPPDENASGDG